MADESATTETPAPEQDPLDKEFEEAVNKIELKSCQVSAREKFLITEWINVLKISNPEEKEIRNQIVKYLCGALDKDIELFTKPPFNAIPAEFNHPLENLRAIIVRISTINTSICSHSFHSFHSLYSYVYLLIIYNSHNDLAALSTPPKRRNVPIYRSSLPTYLIKVNFYRSNPFPGKVPLPYWWLSRMRTPCWINPLVVPILAIKRNKDKWQQQQ